MYYISIELNSVGLQWVSYDWSLALGIKLLFTLLLAFVWESFSHFSVALSLPSCCSFHSFISISCISFSILVLHQCVSQSADVLARVCCWIQYWCYVMWKTLVLFSHMCHSKTTARSNVSGCENVTDHTWLHLQISVAFSIVRLTPLLWLKS